MDILGAHPALLLSGNGWRVLSRHDNAPPQYIGAEAVVENSSITEGCEILGTVQNSVLGENVRVMQGAVVRDAVLMGNCIVREDAVVEYAILDQEVEVGAGARVGGARAVPGNGIAVVGGGVKIAAGAEVAPGAMISE